MLQVVIVHKKSEEICLCIDFQALNVITVCDSFPLPQIEEALQAVKAAVWFASFDLAQGYLQMVMNEADIHKTAFHVGSSGLYEFTRMSFGISNGGASFCCLMEMCLGDQQYLTLLFYLDDICVFSSSIGEMLDRIKLVFSHLKDFNLKIKPKKSLFFQLNVLFLGHILSKDRISPNSEKKHAGTKVPLLPPNLPPFQWTPDQQEAFEKLKQALITAPILAYPNYMKPFILETDTSLKGLVAVLM